MNRYRPSTTFWKLLSVGVVLFAGVFSIAFWTNNASLSQASPDFSVRAAGYGFDVLLPALLDIRTTTSVAMRFGNTLEELSFAEWEPIRSLRWWWLPTGRANTDVFAEFRETDDTIMKRRTHLILERENISAPCLSAFHSIPYCGIRVSQQDQLLTSMPFRPNETFDDGNAFWWSYLYDDSFSGNIFYPTTWHTKGGAENSGFISTDHSRWAIDSPENPDSVLALLTYRNWTRSEPIDLRGATVSLQLRGDMLNLKGGAIYFWVLDNETRMRWHYVAEPLTFVEGAWGPAVSITLTNNPDLWHNSWDSPPQGAAPGNLNDVLASVDSYGISFVGFPTGDEPTGRLSLDNLSITPAE